MAKDGMKLIKNSPRFPKSLVTTREADSYIAKATITFSFLYFRQMEYFGFDRTDTKWFVGLLNRLQDLSSKENFGQDKQENSRYRFHEINWAAKNIPIKIADLAWIPKEYLENTVEFPIKQIAISKAKGRIIGFLNANSNVFYIVLLDPLHNLQPSGDFGFKVDNCSPLQSSYEALIAHLDAQKEVSKKCSCSKPCPVLNQPIYDTNILTCQLDDSYKDELLELLKNHSLKDIIETGIIGLSS